MSVSCDAALRSLDDSSSFLSESSAKLRAGTLVDVTQIIEHLKTASESARIVREAVLSELPDASWQNREELDALVERIRSISEQRAAVQRRRSRLAALAAALESGSIIHRRAQRSAELTQLRDHAVDELRAQAALESASPALPGPEADRWIEWACGLKEPEDAESLQNIRGGFPHLDDFIANLELSMWMAGSSGATDKLGAEQAAPKAEPGESRREIDEPENLLQSSSRTQIEPSKPANSVGERHEDRFSSNELSAPTGSKPQPLDDSRALTKEEPGRAQERKSLAFAQLMVMGDIADPVGRDQGPEQSKSPTAGFCETATQPGTAPQVESSRSMAKSSSLAVMPEVEEPSSVSRAKNARLPVETGKSGPSLSAEWLAAKFETEPDESPFPYELYGLSVAAGLNTPEAADKDQKLIDEELQRSQERALARLMAIDGDQRETATASADASRETAAPTSRAAAAADYGINNAVQRFLAGKWWIMLTAVLALLVAAGFLMWRGSRNTSSNRARDPAQTALAAPKQSNPPELKGSAPAATTTEPEALAVAPVTRTQQEPKPRENSSARDSSAKGRAAKQAGEHDAALLRPTLAIPGHTKKEESASAAGADTPALVAGGSINGVPNGIAPVLTNVPAVVPPKVAPQKDTSSELEAAVLLRQVQPRYPRLAREAQVEGTVVLEGVVGTDGTLHNLRVVRGDPRLVQAAMDAARQWRYKPSRLHGQPVESETQIIINFSLTGG
jgi:TonB family protein